MAYDPQVVQMARQQLAQRAQTARDRAAALRREMTGRIPRIKEIERELAATMPTLTNAILSGDAAAVEKIKEYNLALQQELATILRQAGCGVDSFAPQFTCPVCHDTGYVDGHICSCYLKLLQEEACKHLSRLSAMKLTDFDSLEMAYYDVVTDSQLGVPPRQQMGDIIAYCRAYASHFHPAADSLLLTGATGTGKTHLSLAIAKAVTEAGYGVVYGSVGPLLRRLEDERFGRAEGDSESQMVSCDLLILDDLGMEFDTPLGRSFIYNILNARLLENRPTIISTNLSPTALKARYGDQIASRISGGFEPLLCVGKDMRQVLRQRKMQ